MKKLLLSLGTVAAIAAPVASVVACGKTSTVDAQLDAAKKSAISMLDHYVGLSAADKATDIAKINGAKDMTALKAVMIALNPAQPGNTGTQTPAAAGNTGTKTSAQAPAAAANTGSGSTNAKAPAQAPAKTVTP